MPTQQPADYRIFCIVVGKTRSFSVKISPHETVDELKKAIKLEIPAFNDLATHDLDLYLIDPATDGSLTEKVEKLLAGHPPPLEPTEELSAVFLGPPVQGIVHIAVQTPQTAEFIPPTGLKRKASADTDNGVPKKARYEKDIMHQLVKKWSQPSPALRLQDLHAYLRQPLEEEEKIPISQQLFDRMSNSSSYVPPESVLSAEELATLFRVSIDECAGDVETLFLYAVNKNLPKSGTERLFHSTWDVNISNILTLIVSCAEPIRNSNRNASTALKLPDYGLLVKNHCIFRGEEKGSYTSGDPARELVDKLKWTYDPLPYILGYHAVTTAVRFVAITPRPPTNVPLFNHNLKFRNERVANLVHLIRLSAIVAQLGELLPRRDMAEFVPFELKGGDVLMTIGAVVKKQFRHPDAATHVSKLIEIYNLLKLKQVRNVDSLYHAEIREKCPYVLLSPVGCDVSPNSDSEAFNAVFCVLQALKVMHSSPHPVYHRDIRGPNIMRTIDGKGWFLIDWSDASMTPTLAATHLKRAEHSPSVHQDNHGAEVDIWGPAKVQEMARRWIADITTSAEAALNEINANEHLFTEPAAQIN